MKVRILVQEKVLLNWKEHKKGDVVVHDIPEGHAITWGKVLGPADEPASAAAPLPEEPSALSQMARAEELEEAAKLKARGFTPEVLSPRLMPVDVAPPPPVRPFTPPELPVPPEAPPTGLLS